jgi:hypothetical protein
MQPYRSRIDLRLADLAINPSALRRSPSQSQLQQPQLIALVPLSLPLSLPLPIVRCIPSTSHLPIPGGNVEQTNSGFVCHTKTASFGPKAPGRPLTLSKHVVQVRHSEVWAEAEISFVIARLLFERDRDESRVALDLFCCSRESSGCGGL